MNIPLLLAAIVYAAGVVAGSYLPGSLWVGFALACSLIAGALFWSRKRLVLGAASIFAIGLCNQQLQTTVLSPHDLRTLLGTKPAYVTLTGTLSETPYQKFYEHRQEITWRTLAELDVETIRFDGEGAVRPAHGKVAVSTPGVLGTWFFKGQRITVSGVVDLPPGPAAEDLFDYRHYLQLKGIYYQMQVKSPGEWTLLSTNSTPPLADRFQAWAQKTLARGLPEEDETLRLLWAMTLGWKTAMSGEVSEPFMRSGTMHVFAISGLHIALIAGILVALFKVLKVPRWAGGMFVIPLIWIYTFFTGLQASAVRSTIMMTVIIAGWILKRPGNLLNSLGAAALIILVWDPQQLFQASFQLSFLVVLSLGLFVPKLEILRKELLAPDPFLPAQLRPRWRRKLDPPIYWLTTSLVTSTATWLGSVPLTAYYFHLFTPASLIANLVVVPLSSCALASNMASLICGDWLPAQGELFNHAAWGFMTWMVKASEWAADLPSGCFHIPAPGPLLFLFYYLVLVGVMAGWFRNPLFRLPLSATAGALLLVWAGLKVPGYFMTKLTVLPLHGGNAIFLDANGHRDDWLIDCGDSDSARNITSAFLRAQGVNCLHQLALTHGDIRHVGGADLIQQKFSTPRVFLSPVRFRSAAYRAVRASFSKMPGLERIVQQGERAGTWEVLHPGQPGHSSQADDNALALRGKFRGTTVLLLSDLSKPGQNELARNNTNLQADIIISGLPVRTEPVANLFLDLVQPKLIIITDALFPARDRAGAALKERLKRKGIPVLYASETGAITLEMRKSGWQIKTSSGLRLASLDLKSAPPENESTTPPRDELEE